MTKLNDFGRPEYIVAAGSGEFFYGFIRADLVAILAGVLIAAAGAIGVRLISPRRPRTRGLVCRRQTWGCLANSSISSERVSCRPLPLTRWSNPKYRPRRSSEVAPRHSCKVAAVERISRK